MKMSQIGKIRLTVIGVFIVTILAGFLVYPALFNQPVGWVNKKLGLGVPNYWNLPFRLGLDLQGGTHLVYQADVSQVPSADQESAVDGVRDVIERRVNAFGVAEPLVQVTGGQGNYRVVVELAGVKDVQQAIEMIGKTPLLEFKEEGMATGLTAAEEKQLAADNAAVEKKAKDVLREVLNSPIEKFGELAQKYSEDTGSAAKGGDLGWAKRGDFVGPFDTAIFDTLKVGQITPSLVKSDFGYHIIYKEAERGEGDGREVQSRHILLKTKTAEDIHPTDQWAYTGLTGKQLKKAQVEFDQTSGSPTIGLEFDTDGTKLFADITSRNVGKVVGIFLDGQPISLPRVQSAIPDGRAVITGTFTLPEAKQLAQDLNAGALPVPVTLAAQQTVGATLGADSVQKSLFAGLVGILAVIVFMVLYYRLPGVFAAIALVIYGALVLAVFKLTHITLTLSGIAGFILSLGMAVDANVLIFERLKEELHGGRPLSAAIDEAFRRAWSSIRDSNLSTLITCAILYWLTTSSVRGFALTLIIGILVSMFTAVSVTRGLLKSVLGQGAEQWYFVLNRKRPTPPTTPTV